MTRKTIKIYINISEKIPQSGVYFKSAVKHMMKHMIKHMMRQAQMPRVTAFIYDKTSTDA